MNWPTFYGGGGPIAICLTLHVVTTSKHKSWFAFEKNDVLNIVNWFQRGGRHAT